MGIIGILISGFIKQGTHNVGVGDGRMNMGPSNITPGTNIESPGSPEGGSVGSSETSDSSESFESAGAGLFAAAGAGGAAIIARVAGMQAAVVTLPAIHA